MSDEDNDFHDEPASPAQAFAGLQDHVDGYKRYVKKLKKGASSGISGMFGVARDLLPEEELQESEPVGKHLEPDKSIQKKGSPADTSRTSQHATSTSIDEMEPLVDALASEFSSSPHPDSQMTAELPQEQAAAGHVDLRITTATGEPLWDVVLAGDSVSEVFFSDGSRILASNEPGKYVYISSRRSDLESGAAQIITKPICDPETGNLFFRLASGERATALLNNGFRIDQYSKDEGEDDYFVTEPCMPGTLARSRSQVTNLTMDQETGCVSYETVNGGLSVTMRFRKL